MNRRELLQGSLAAGAVLSLPIIGMRPARAADPITIYGVKSLSGSGADFGKYANMGSKLAVKDYGSVLDRDIVYKTIDTESSPSTAVRKVQEAMQQDGALLFDGATFSSTALAVGKKVNQGGGVFMTPAGADEITGKDCNPATFRWSVPTYGAIRETVAPLISQKPDAKRWYTITPDYVFGKALLKNAKEVFKEAGVEHVGNSFHSLKTQQFSGYLANAMAANPDVLLLLNFAGQASRCLRQAVNFGLKNKMTILVAWTAGLSQFQSLGPDILDDVYLGAQYWHEVDAPMNLKLVKRVEEVYDIKPPYPLAADYISTRVILDGVAKAGSDDGKAVSQAMAGMTYEGPTGKETIRASNHQVLKKYYLLLGKSKSQMKDKDDYADIISSGKSFRPESDDMCKMA